MFWPSGAIIPDSGSIQATFTVPDWAKAAGDARTTDAANAAATERNPVMGVSSL